MKPKQKTTPTRAERRWLGVLRTRQQERICMACKKPEAAQLITNCGARVHPRCSEKMKKILLVHGSQRFHCIQCWKHFFEKLTNVERDYVAAVSTPVTDPMLYQEPNKK